MGVEGRERERWVPYLYTHTHAHTQTPFRYPRIRSLYPLFPHLGKVLRYPPIKIDIGEILTSPTSTADISLHGRYIYGARPSNRGTERTEGGQERVGGRERSGIVLGGASCFFFPLSLPLFFFFLSFLFFFPFLSSSSLSIYVIPMTQGYK